jgi:hypothetical protein
LRRPEKDVPEVMLVRSKPTRVIECLGVEDSKAWPPLESEADVRSALGAELKIEPPARLVRDMTILRQGPTVDLNLLFVESRYDSEG